MKRLVEYSADVVLMSLFALLFFMIFVWWGTDPGTAGRILIAAYSLLSAVYMVLWDRYQDESGKWEK